jgi:cytochrome c-type biogenesis protein CcmH/NrfG
MKPENLVFAVAGTLFGLIVGWIVGTQQAPRAGAQAAVSPAAASAPAAAAPAAAARPMLDEAQVTAMRTVAERDPKNVESRIQLGNLYFDAERYQDAIGWYEQAFALDGSNANVSTDLAVSYYYTNQVDKSLEQFARSLTADPRHVKTYLNMGIVRAFGKQDLKGAAEAWEQVLKLAPGSDEAQAARRALDNLNAAHPDGAVQPPAGQAPPAK